MDLVEIDPAILYLGTPVALLSTVSADGRPNLAPMSSVFWLGRTAVLGMGGRSHKHGVGYRHVPDKFARAGLTPVPSATVRPAAVGECPVNLEAHLLDAQPLQEFEPGRDSGTVLFQLHVTRVLVHDAIRMPGTDDRIDPDRWRPLVMSFQRFYGLGGEVHASRLSGIDEEWYRDTPVPADTMPAA